MTTLEYLVQIDINAGDADPVLVDELRRMEAQRARELAAAGNLVRLWRIQGRWANVGIWRASHDAELRNLLDSLPLRPYMTIAHQALEPHPSDPGEADHD